MNFTRSPCSPVQMLKTLEVFLPDLDGKTLLTSNADNILCHGPLARNNCNPPLLLESNMSGRSMMDLCLTSRYHHP